MTINLEQQVREYAEFLDTTLPVIDPDTITSTVPEVVPVVVASEPRRKFARRLEPKRRLPGWAVALAAALVVIVAVGGVSLLLGTLRDSSPPVDPATTVPSPWLVESFIEFPVDEFPPFTAVVQFTGEEGDLAAYCEDSLNQYLAEHPDASSQELQKVEADLGCTEADVRGQSSGPAASTRVSFAGPSEGLRVEVMESVGSEGPNAGPGSFLVFDGRRAATYLGGGDVFLVFPDEELATVNLGEFGWSYWAQVCGPARREFFDNEVIAGRDAIHLTCSRAATWELWVDAETGVMLKVNGIFGPIMDQLSHPASWTGFLVEDIDYVPSLASKLFSVRAPAGAPEREMDRSRRGTLAAGGDLADGDDIDEQFDEEQPHPLVGQPAPPLVGTSLDGAQFDLVQHRGRPTAVMFWFAGCGTSPPCRLQLEVFEQAKSQWSDQIMFVIVAVASDVDGVRAMAAEADLTVPIVAEQNTRYPDWEGALTPALYLIDEQGIVVSSSFGFDASRDLLDEPGTFLGDISAALQ